MASGAAHFTIWIISHCPGAGGVGQLNYPLAQDQQAQDQAQMESDYLGLKSIEQVVLWRMLAQGPRFRRTTPRH